MTTALAYSLFERHDGHTFAYKLLGRTRPATPLVLVHGLSAVGLVDWLPLAAELAKHRPVLIFDNRGIGSSRAPKGKEGEKYTAGDMAQDVVELVKHLRFKEIDILGFSMGGMIVSTVLVSPSLPFKIRHAVLAATSAKPAHSDLLQAIPSPPSGKVMSLEENKALVTPFIHVGYDPAFLQNPQNKEMLDRRITESATTRRPARTVQHQIGVIAGYDVRKQLRSIPETLPVLILHGKLDRSVYYSESAYLTRGVPHAQLLTFDGIGHMWYDYFTLSYWITLLNCFLNDGGDVASLVPPALPQTARL
ncbi:hypothetical protein JCM6882_008718 [Rhodosporidiobolus microsporus]